MLHVYSSDMTAKELKTLLMDKRKGGEFTWFPEVRDGLPLTPLELRMRIRRTYSGYIVTISPVVVDELGELIRTGFLEHESVILHWVTLKGIRKAHFNHRGQVIDHWPQEKQNTH